MLGRLDSSEGDGNNALCNKVTQSDLYLRKYLLPTVKVIIQARTDKEAVAIRTEING